MVQKPQASAPETDQPAPNQGTDALAFLATMSHELRTPMTGIVGAAELLAGSRLDGEQARLVRTIIASGEAMMRLLNDILDLSKIESGRWELEDAPFVLRGLLGEVVGVWRLAAEQKGVRLDLHVDTEVPDTLCGDAGRLRQVLVNLLSNAVKFTAAGRVGLSVTANGDRLRFTVADTGAGIPADRIGVLFQPYRQGSADTQRRHGGTGLGLAICRGLVRLMGGKIGLDSVAGEGTRVWFTLPARIPPAIPDVVASVTPAVLPPMKLLLVEDHPVNQAVIGAMLVRMGHVVDIVGDGRAAVDAVRQGDYEAVLMDVQMPVLDGVAATREIRALDGAAAATPVIALTAEAMPRDRARLLAAGMDDYLAKPVDFALLAAALHRARSGEPMPQDVAPARPAMKEGPAQADARTLLEQLAKAAENLA